MSVFMTEILNLNKSDGFQSKHETFDENNSEITSVT
jgi:hypothetical protein